MCVEQVRIGASTPASSRALVLVGGDIVEQHAIDVVYRIVRQLQFVVVRHFYLSVFVQHTDKGAEVDALAHVCPLQVGQLAVVAEPLVQLAAAKGL